MKANELRIWNWYHHRTIDNPRQITANDILDMCHRPQNGIDLIYKPIPLTEEWLLKFDGFIKEKNIPFYSIALKYNAILQINPENGLCLIFTSTRSNNSGIQIWIDNVHQLQNLYFALTGEELTIKL